MRRGPGTWPGSRGPAATRPRSVARGVSSAAASCAVTQASVGEPAVGSLSPGCRPAEHDEAWRSGFSGRWKSLETTARYWMWAALRPRAWLIALALAGGHPVPADQLLDQVWRGEQAMDRTGSRSISRGCAWTLGGDCISTRALQLRPRGPGRGPGRRSVRAAGGGGARGAAAGGRGTGGRTATASAGTGGAGHR